MRTKIIMLPIVALGLLVSCENKENPKEPTGEYDGTEMMVIETVPSASSYFETGKEHKITLTTSAISRLSGIYIRDYYPVDGQWTMDEEEIRCADSCGDAIATFSLRWCKVVQMNDKEYSITLAPHDNWGVLKLIFIGLDMPASCGFQYGRKEDVQP